MIFIPRSQTKGYVVGHWPIPEDYWLNLNSPTLVITNAKLMKHFKRDLTLMISFLKPKRSAHPLVKFKCDSAEPMAIDEIPFDRYELEPSPLTQFILERRQPNVAWLVSDHSFTNCSIITTRGKHLTRFGTSLSAMCQTAAAKSTNSEALSDT